MDMKLVFRIVLGLLIVTMGVPLSAQIVTISPTFFTVDDEITVTYDATQGNKGLAGIDQVYAHTGIITKAGGAGNWQNVQGQWGTDDAKVKMISIGNDKHTLTYKIRDFYAIANAEVVQLSFVFRNVDGSKEGKTANQGDIFVDIPEDEEFTGFFKSPNQRFLVLEDQEEINVDIAISQVANVAVYDNDNLIIQKENVSQLQFSLIATGAGDHIVRFEAINNGDTIRSEFSYLINTPTETIALPTDVFAGWNRISNTEAIIALHAPLKESVYLIGDFSEWKLNSRFQLNETPEGDVFWLKLENLEANSPVEYQFLIDGELLVADPLSHLVLDPNHDNFIDNKKFEFLDDYPKGMTEGIVSVGLLSQDDFQWQHDEANLAQDEELIIYEILLRDFLGDHSYASLQDTLSYLKSLGINAIELMPIQEFEGNNSWGYNPSYHGALDKYYGSPIELKSFVDAAHGMGIAVILDVVYNHAFGQSPLVSMYWDGANNRPAANSPYFNTIAKHPFNVGFDFNHNSPSTQSYVKHTLSRWIAEFHFDGFRFDLSKGFTQRESSDNDSFSSLDIDRVNILKSYADHIWSQDDDSYIILEHFADNSEERELADYGMMLWGNANFNFNEATMGYHDNSKSDFGHIAAIDSRGWSSNRLVGYMESHDEERLMYKNIQFGNRNAAYSTREIPTGLKRVEMAAAFFLAIPGPKMIWQFGELGYDQSINRCTDGSISEDCRLSDRPILWSYLQERNRKSLFDTYAGLIKIKKENPVYKNGTYNAALNAAVKRITLESADQDVIIVGNFDVTTSNYSFSFTRSGVWYDLVEGDSLMVDDLSMSINLAPGEYHIYSSIQADFTLGVDHALLADADITIAPNPTSGAVSISLTSQQLRSGLIQVIDINGKVIWDRTLEVGSGGREVTLNENETLEAGSYFVRFITDEGYLIRPLIIQ